MDLKTQIIRSLERATVDKKELHDTVLKYRRRFDEAARVLQTEEKKQ